MSFVDQQAAWGGHQNSAMNSQTDFAIYGNASSSASIVSGPVVTAIVVTENEKFRDSAADLRSSSCNQNDAPQLPEKDAFTKSEVTLNQGGAPDARESQDDVHSASQSILSEPGVQMVCTACCRFAKKSY